jgi:hypothetical protein
MEELILSHKNPQICDSLKNIYCLLKKFKDIWFVRDAKATVDYLIEFDIEFSNIVSFIFNSFDNNDDSNKKILKAFDVMYIFNHMTDKKFNKIFKIPLKYDNKEELILQRTNAYNAWKYLHNKLSVNNFIEKFKVEYDSFCKIKSDNFSKYKKINSKYTSYNKL